MICRVSWHIPVFLSVILTLGCNSSVKHVQIDEITKDAELMADLQAPPEQPLGLERTFIGLESPFTPLQHPPIAIFPETDIQLQIHNAMPNSKVDLKILAVTPAPGVDYKIVAVTPDSGIDYKMLIVPSQKHSPHVIGTLDVPFMPEVPPIPNVPHVPWKPKD